MMTIQIEGRTFKSGNSTAVRLPKALGIEPGTDIEIIKDGKGIHILEKRRKLDLTGIWGCCPDLERLPFEDVKRDWGGSLSGND